MRLPLLNFPQALWRQRELWWQLSQREVQGRYRGSMLGWGWSLITPLLMLAGTPNSTIAKWHLDLRIHIKL